MNERTLLHLRQAAEQLWPMSTAEEWDRVGLVSGRDDAPLRKVLLAVDAVSGTVAEATEWGADALVTHHPLLLRGVHTIAEDTAKGALLSKLLRSGCALLAAHTNADAPSGGVSDVLAERFGLKSCQAIVPTENMTVGIGRVGTLETPLSLEDFATLVAHQLPRTAGGVRVAGDPALRVRTVALCGGAGDSLLSNPLVRGADVYVTSDLRHHPAQESREQALATSGPALIDVSHWAAESLWLDHAAQQLGALLPDVEFRVSALNTDPWVFTVGLSACRQANANKNFCSHCKTSTMPPRG